MMEPSSLPSIPPPEGWVPYVVGAAVAVITTLAGAVAALWRYYAKRQGHSESEHAKEREAWAHERTGWAVERTRLETARAELRSEYEARHNTVATQYAQAIRDLYESTLAHENAARADYARNIEVVQSKQSESMDKLRMLLDKIYDRFIAPRRPRD